MTGIVLPYWPDTPALEALDVAGTADRLGFDELWIGEMATFDAFALAGSLAVRTSRPLTVGPLAVGVRDPVALALGIGSIAALGARPAQLALGASTPFVVERWHGRPWHHTVTQLRETVEALRPMLAGERSDFEGDQVRTTGFRLRVAPPNATITLAAFGPRTVRLAGEIADRMVLNLVTVDQVARLRAALAEAAAAAGRSTPPIACWIATAVDPSPSALDQLRRALVAYAGAPGYGEMFTDAGFGHVVTLARSGAHPREVLAAVPVELVEAIGAVGSAATVAQRLDEFHAAGVDDLALVPATAGDEAAARTLTELATWRPRTSTT